MSWEIFSAFFLRKIETFEFFGLRAKIVRQCCQNCILRVQRNILKKIDFFLLKMAIVYSFWDNLLKKFNSLAETFFQQGCRNCIQSVPRNILRKNIFFWKFYNCSPVFGLLAKAFLSAVAVLSKLHSTRPEEHSEENFFWKIHDS